MRMNNLPISGIILKEKAIIYTQEHKLRFFMLPMDYLKDGRWVISFEYTKLSNFLKKISNPFLQVWI